MSQNDFASKEFNSTNFLSTLFYTKYEFENNNTHFVITKGKKKCEDTSNCNTKDNKFLRKCGKFNSLNSGDKIAETKITLLENKSNELVSRINKLKENNNDPYTITSSEIKILGRELGDLQKVYEEINSSNYYNSKKGFWIMISLEAMVRLKSMFL